MKARHLALAHLRHTVSDRGKGKWQSVRGLKRYKLARRRRNLIAAASRRENRS